MSTLQIDISVPECPVGFSFYDLKETPEVKRWLASPEGKRRTKISTARVFIPDIDTTLILLGFLPFQIILLLAFLDPETTFERDTFPEHWHNWLRGSGVLMLLSGGYMMREMHHDIRMPRLIIPDDTLADETTPLFSTSAYIKTSGTHHVNQTESKKFIGKHVHPYLISKDAIVQNFRKEHGWRRCGVWDRRMFLFKLMVDSWIMLMVMIISYRIGGRYKYLACTMTGLVFMTVEASSLKSYLPRTPDYPPTHQGSGDVERNCRAIMCSGKMCE